MPRGHLSRGSIILGEIGGNCTGGNYPGGNCPRWELFGKKCPGCNFPEGICPVPQSTILVLKLFVSSFLLAPGIIYSNTCLDKMNSLMTHFLG